VTTSPRCGDAVCLAQLAASYIWTQQELIERGLEERPGEAFLLLNIYKVVVRTKYKQR
jgi:hypothetical protein